MSNRKKRKEKDSISGEPEVSSLRILAQLCGTPPCPQDESRSKMISSLIPLLNCLKSLIRLENAELQSLRNLEDIVGRVRKARRSFSEYLVLESEEVYSVYEELEDENVFVTEAVMMARSMVASYRSQMLLEENVMKEIGCVLSYLYLHEESIPLNSSTKIAGWIKILDRRPLLEARRWKRTFDQFESNHHPFDPAIVPSPEPLFEECAVESMQDASPKKRVGFADSTVDDALEGFLDESVSSSGEVSPTLLLVVGKQGSGKSFLCDGIEKRMKEAQMFGDNTLVIRPTLPLDTLGTTVGDTEESLISLIIAACKERKSILILDNLEHIIGEGYSGQSISSSGASSAMDVPEPHVLARSRATLLSLLDALTNSTYPPHPGASRLLVIITTSTPSHNPLHRVDRIIFLRPPDDGERRAIIEECFEIDVAHKSDQEDLEDTVDLLTRITVGKSRADVAQCCQKAITSSTYGTVAAGNCVSAKMAAKTGALVAMKSHLENVEPESLRSGAISDFVDMTVLTASELLHGGAGVPDFPLFGEEAAHARKSIESLIVFPLCHSNALDNILFTDSTTDQKVMCGGVLLTGGPGCGKTELAYHCARMTSSALPSVILIDVVCTSLVHKELGSSERALQRLFESARAAAPCILLMDGIESIGATRGHDNTTEGTMDRVLSTLLTELDGASSSFSRGQLMGNKAYRGKIAIIGITQDEKWIDPALRRPGRFEKVIRLNKPNWDVRNKIARRELLATGTPFVSRDKALSSLVPAVVNGTDGMSGADVVASCQDARMARFRNEVRNDRDVALA